MSKIYLIILLTLGLMVGGYGCGRSTEKTKVEPKVVEENMVEEKAQVPAETGEKAEVPVLAEEQQSGKTEVPVPAEAPDEGEESPVVE
jgi:hypothetical protein